VTLAAPAELGAGKLAYTLDGTAPGPASPTYESPLTLDRALTLRARLFRSGQPVGKETSVVFTAPRLPERGLLGVWSAARLNGRTLANGVAGAAADLVLPEGTATSQDPARGPVLNLDHSSIIRLAPTAILDNDLTVAVWVNTKDACTLLRYGYAHTGVFIDIGKDGGINASGGRVWNAAKTKGGLLNDGAWHHVAATYGGGPIRQITVYVDGRQVASGRSPAPCLTNELELLAGYTGLLGEYRLYNRVLAPDEIAVLARP
jgi:hypothetical protein